MPTKTKSIKKTKTAVLPASSANLKKALHTEAACPPLREQFLSKARSRKRPAPADSDLEDEGTATRKTPMRAVRRKVENTPIEKPKAVTRKKSARESKEQIDEEPKIPTKKKIVRRKMQEVPSVDDRTSVSSSKKKPSVEKPSRNKSSFEVVHVDENPVRIPEKKRNVSSCTKKAVLEVRVDEPEQVPFIAPEKKTYGQQKTLSKRSKIQVNENETTEIDHDGDKLPNKIPRKKIAKKNSKMTSTDRALQPIGLAVKEEDNAEKEPPVVKKKAITKVVKKKTSDPVIYQDAIENIPEKPESDTLVKKRSARRRSHLSVELPLTPARKRAVPNVTENGGLARRRSHLSVELPLTPARKRAVSNVTENGDFPLQNTAKASKKVLQRNPSRKSPEPLNRNADILCQSGDGSDIEGRENTTTTAAVSKNSLARRAHAPDKPPKRRVAPSSSIQVSVKDVYEHEDDAAPKPVRPVRLKSGLPPAEESSMPLRPVPAKPSKPADQMHATNGRKHSTQQIDIIPTTETNERQTDRKEPVPFMPATSILRSPGPSDISNDSPYRPYGKPFVFSGIPTGDHHDTVIPLPTSDTPMIQKNKEFRESFGKNRRRSSFTMRGKRASSMSGGNLIALPHPSIPSETFFRHIAAEAPEPIRMKQLLAWCARRIEMPAEDGVDKQALEIAQQVRERIIAAILGGRISTSWYNRQEDDVLPEITGPKELKDHPQNIDNRRLLKEHEDAIARLEQEDAAWTATLRDYNTRHAAIVDSCPILADDPISIDVEGDGEERRVMKEVMDKAMAAVEEQLGDDAMDVDDEWLESTMAEVEIKVDRLHSTLYTANQFNRISREYTEDIFAKLLASLAQKRGDQIDTRTSSDIVGGATTRSPIDPMDLLRTFAASAMASTVKTPATTDGRDEPV